MRPCGFDSRRFYADLQRFAKASGLSMNKLAISAGMESAALSRIGSKGRVPDGINLAALCKVTGLDAAAYSLDMAGTERG